MKNETFAMKYPRRVLARRSMVILGKALLALLADVTIKGREKMPKKGPVILAGNHVAELEAVMMAAYCPGVVEFLGNGDIPFDPNYALLANIYGLIPINRGNLDRKGLSAALGVLNQEGILGIFPEGGTWDPAQMQAQTGIAWLSYRAKAPVIPIGFGGLRGSLGKALKLQRPKLVMNVGDVIPPVELTDSTLSTKANLEKGANTILAKINALVPEKDLHRFRNRIDEAYQLEIKVFSNNTLIPLPVDRQISHGSAYSRFLFNPTMMDVLVRNLKLPIRPLKITCHEDALEDLINAWRSILDYLEINPGFFTYRFGMDEGVAVKKALNELTRFVHWAKEAGYALSITPIRSYQNAKTGALTEERGGLFPESM